MAESRTAGAEHKLTLLNQEQMELTGVSRVESFNPEEISLEIDNGLLSIKGEGLDMHNLNLERGVVEVVGLVTEIRYSAEKAARRRGILEKIFK